MTEDEQGSGPLVALRPATLIDATSRLPVDCCNRSCAPPPDPAPCIDDGGPTNQGRLRAPRLHVERRLPALQIIQQGGGAHRLLSAVGRRTPAWPSNRRLHPCRGIATTRTVPYKHTLSTRSYSGPAGPPVVSRAPNGNVGRYRCRAGRLSLVEGSDVAPGSPAAQRRHRSTVRQTIATSPGCIPIFT